MQFVTIGLHHTMSTIMVFQSEDYKIFKYIVGNRHLNEAKIKRITADIQSGLDVLKYYPIQVVEKDGRLEIIDGQHRYYIAKKLKRPVHYIVVQENRSLVDIAKVNSNVEKWKTTDFISCYVEQGNKNYELLRDFLDKYPFTVTVAIKMLTTGNPGTESGLGSVHQGFQRGALLVDHWDKAVELADKCKLFSDYAIWNQRGFIIALHRIIEAGKVELFELLEKVNKHPEMMKKQSGFKDYIFMLETIYNRGKQIRVTLY